MRYVCELAQRNGQWIAEHRSPNVGPIRVSAPTREEALQKVATEIRYWLEMCPCTGETYRDLEISVQEAGVDR